MVEALESEYSVRQICDALGLHRSSLYYQSKTDPFEQPLFEQPLRDEIEKLSARYPTYGYRRITQLLKRIGYAVGTTRVARLMKEQNLSVAIRRACQTTQSVEGLGQWVNRIENLDICRHYWDNGYAERFIRTLKEEEVYLNEYDDIINARSRIKQFILQVYNHKRPHSALGYLTPVEFDKQLFDKQLLV